MATKNNKKQSSRQKPELPTESRTSEAATIAWTVTLTTLLCCNLITIGAHFFVQMNPDAKKMTILREMLLLASAVVGCLSLALLPLVYRLRKVPPPRGIVVFGVCLAIAPWLVLALRTL